MAKTFCPIFVLLLSYQWIVGQKKDKMENCFVPVLSLYCAKVKISQNWTKTLSYFCPTFVQFCPYYDVRTKVGQNGKYVLSYFCPNH
jgi:hypothetical protein